MPSAPGHAERLSELWLKLPSESRERLMYRWLDRGLRVHAAKAFDLLGYAAVAANLRELGEIRTEAERVKAAETLSTSFQGTDVTHSESWAAIFGVLSALDREAVASIEATVPPLPSGEPRSDAHLFMVCVGIVTSARCVASGLEEELAQVTDVAASSVSE